MSTYLVEAGDLRTTITLQEPTITTDAGAAQKPVYANVASNPTLRVQWTNEFGQEAVQSAAKNTQRATVRMRHRDDILTPTRRTDWRVLKDGEPWNILSIDPVQDRGRWIEMKVERVKGTV